MASEVTEQASHDIRVIVDNDESLVNAVREAVFRQLRDSTGYDEMTADEYRQELGRDSMAYGLRNVVRDIVYDAFVDDVDMQSLQGLALSAFLDYDNTALWEDIAEAYVPSVEDYADHFGEDL